MHQIFFPLIFLINLRFPVNPELKLGPLTFKNKIDVYLKRIQVELYMYHNSTDNFSFCKLCIYGVIKMFIMCLNISLDYQVHFQ